MEDIKHTKGPWVLRDSEVLGPYGSNKHICEITGNFMSESEKKENAKLIATLPDLLIANQILKDTIKEMSDRINAHEARAKNKINLKDELIKFEQWVRIGVNTGDCAFVESMVNHYLKHIANK